MGGHNEPNSERVLGQLSPGCLLHFNARQAWHRLTQSTTTMVVNTDIDGFLSATLLQQAHPDWRVGGFYDNERLWADDETVQLLREDKAAVLWVDISSCWPGVHSVSQHVVAYSPHDLTNLELVTSTFGPSTLMRQVVNRKSAPYTFKYPFGTFQFLWWVWKSPFAADRDLAPDGLWGPIRSGLVWMPDGGADSIAKGHDDRIPKRYCAQIRMNCHQWITQTLPGMPMAESYRPPPLDSAGQPVLEFASRERERIYETYLEPAFAYLRRGVGPGGQPPQAPKELLKDRCWSKSHQMKLGGYEGNKVLEGESRIRHTNPYVVMTSAAVQAELNTIFERIALAFGWQHTAVLPKGLTQYEGERHEVRWRTDQSFDDLVPVKERQDWFSIAFTGHRAASYTVAGVHTSLGTVMRKTR